jgi:hypothetical protein
MIWVVQSPLGKIFRFPSTQIDGSFRAVSFRQEGRIARRHERGTGCGGRESVGANRGRRASQARERSRGVQDERRIARTAKPCGPDTRCWCQACRGFSEPNRVRPNPNLQATVTRRIRRRGEHGISRKTIAQGMPDCSVCTCYSRVRFFAHFCTRVCGCRTHPAFPAPSLSRVSPLQDPDASRRGNGAVRSRYNATAGSPHRQPVGWHLPIEIAARRRSDFCGWKREGLP